MSEHRRLVTPSREAQRIIAMSARAKSKETMSEHRRLVTPSREAQRIIAMSARAKSKETQ